MAYKAFVSSTFEDLNGHRAHVIRSLRRAGFFVDPMEDWPADGDEPKQFSQDRLSGCDLCVLLVAFRRGYVPEGETRSITQLEYDAAVKQGVDILPFLLDENVAWHRKFDERKFDEVGKQDEDAEIAKWRESLRKRYGAEFFNQELRSIDLTGALGRWFSKKNMGQSEHRERKRIDWPEDKSPYPGLLWFNEEYAPLFFGRDREVDELVGKMSEPGGRALLVSGASGSGKSSLVAAGLWQAVINEGRLSGSERWVWHRIQPGDGETPFHSLAWGLKQAFPRISKRAPDLANELAGNQTTIGELLAPQLAQGQELVLFIDQLEELFTQSFMNEGIRNFLEQLVAASRDKQNRLRVVATVRSEFIARLEESEPMLQVLNAGYNYHLGPVSPRTLQDMIEKPALATGYVFEPQLVDDILRESAQEPGGLPLVAYALKELFDRRRERTFTRDAYKAIGGVAGAIGTKADQVMQDVDEQVAGAFDTVFAELVHLEREHPPTRKRASLAAFTTHKAANQLIDALAGPDCRILVRGGEEQETTVEVAHEKLFTAWPRLKNWIGNAGESLRLIEHAAEAARRWQEGGDNPQELWLGTRAKEVLAALQRFDKNPSPVLERFLRPQHLLIGQLNQDTLSHELRALIGRILNEFGDTRPGVGLRPDGLPDIAWIEIPPGSIKIEDVNHVFEVKPFRMAKYLVTNTQFEAFIKAEDGYRNEEWWNGIERSEGASVASWQEANVPRETVSWFEAVAFCRWLSHRTGSRLRLPAEWEWQQAATGGDTSRNFPWPGEWDAARCNGGESHLNRTTVVGMYPSGATQQGVMDMAGNVWEWCLNKYEDPVAPESLRIDDSNVKCVIRGGSWLNLAGGLRVSSRIRFNAGYLNDDLGFRLAQDIP